jgi:hypothetical protein
MKDIQLNKNQMQALKFTLDNKCIVSALTLHRHMQCDRATAKNLIEQLVDLEFLTLCSNGQHMLSPDGMDYLVMKGVPGANVKKNITATVESAAKKLADRETTGLKDAIQKPVEVKTIGVDVQAGGLVADEPKPRHTIEHLKEEAQTARNRLSELKASELIDFDTLVRQGLDRLNKRLGYDPVEIKNADLKAEILLNLSTNVWEISEEIAAILKEIANDIQRCSGGAK